MKLLRRINRELNRELGGSRLVLWSVTGVLSVLMLGLAAVL